MYSQTIEAHPFFTSLTLDEFASILLAETPSHLRKFRQELRSVEEANAAVEEYAYTSLYEAQEIRSYLQANFVPMTPLIVSVAETLDAIEEGIANACLEERRNWFAAVAEEANNCPF